MSTISKEPREFSEFVTDLAYGTVNHKLTEKLGKVVAAVCETGRAGSLSVKFTIKREGEMATVSSSISHSIPEHPMNSSLFFFGENGRLVREDERQLALRGLDDAPVQLLKTIHNEGAHHAEID